jgi:4-amino-4-deoxy-L-arabinose transferase
MIRSRKTSRVLAARLGVLLLPVLLLAPFVGLGRRGLFESDEGRYAAVALEMVESGEWIVPRFDPQAVHLSKPPLFYWALAASMAAFGKSEWALRLPGVIGYWLGCLGVGLAARALGMRVWPAVWIFASAVPVSVAAEIVSTDMLLTGLGTLAVGCWLLSVESSFGDRWRALAGGLFGVAVLVKGTPALLPLLAMAAWRVWERRSEPILGIAGWIAMMAVALPWFVMVLLRHPDAGAYWLGYEVFARFFTGAHDRHSQWFGFIEAYAGVLVLGALPWAWLAWPRPGIHPGGDTDPKTRFLGWWFWLPLALLSLSRSRLPLYVLPLFAPAALLLARRAEGRNALACTLATSLALLALGLGLRHVLAQWPSHRDARAEAASIAPWLRTDTERIVFLGMPAHYGLRFYTGVPVLRAEGTEFLRFRGENWMRLSDVGASRIVVVIGDNIGSETLAEARDRFRGARWLSWERVRCGRQSLLCPELPEWASVSRFRDRSPEESP